MCEATTSTKDSNESLQRGDKVLYGDGEEMRFVISRRERSQLRPEICGGDSDDSPLIGADLDPFRNCSIWNSSPLSDLRKHNRKGKFTSSSDSSGSKCQMDMALIERSEQGVLGGTPIRISLRISYSYGGAPQTPCSLRSIFPMLLLPSGHRRPALILGLYPTIIMPLCPREREAKTC